MSRNHALVSFEGDDTHPSTKLLPFLFLWLVQRILAGPPTSPFLCIPPRQWSLTNAHGNTNCLIFPGTEELV